MRRHPWREVVWRQPEDRTFPVRVALRAERGGGDLATEGGLLDLARMGLVTSRMTSKQWLRSQDR